MIPTDDQSVLAAFRYGEVTGRGLLSTALELSPHLPRKPQIVDDPLDLILDASAATDRARGAKARCIPLSQNVGERPQAFPLLLEPLDQAKLIIEKRHKLRGPGLREAFPTRATEAKPQRVPELLLRKSDRKPQDRHPIRVLTDQAS